MVVIMAVTAAVPEGMVLMEQEEVIGARAVRLFLRLRSAAEEAALATPTEAAEAAVVMAAAVGHLEVVKEKAPAGAADI